MLKIIKDLGMRERDSVKRIESLFQGNKLSDILKKNFLLKKKSNYLPNSKKNSIFTDNFF